MLLYTPTKVYSERNCIKNHAQELGSYGTKAMLVTGRSSARKSGALKDVIDVLESQNLSYVIFEEIEENPSIETVMWARQIGLDEKVDFVIGIGGGSPLDAAKAIAMMIANPTETEDVLYTAKEIPHLPVVCIPTTCGTGSEVTPYAILTIHKKRTKKSISHRIYPALALLDYTYLKSMPREGLVNTAVDALAHLLESYLNTNSNEWNRIYSREGLAVWAQFKEHLLANQLTEADYEKMLRASSIAGMAITHTGTSLPHGLSYPLTYELKMPHGKAVGYFLGGFVSQYGNKEEVRRVLDILGFKDVTEFGKYLKELLGPINVSDELLERSAKDILSDSRKLKNYPFEITEQEIMNMIMEERK